MSKGHTILQSVWFTLEKVEGMSDTARRVTPFPFPQPLSENSPQSIDTLTFPLSWKDTAGGMLGQCWGPWHQANRATDLSIPASTAAPPLPHNQGTCFSWVLATALKLSGSLPHHPLHMRSSGQFICPRRRLHPLLTLKHLPFLLLSLHFSRASERSKSPEMG